MYLGHNAWVYKYVALNDEVVVTPCNHREDVNGGRCKDQSRTDWSTMDWAALGSAFYERLFIWWTQKGAAEQVGRKA